MSRPTERQMEALREVAAFHAEHGYPIAYRELCGRLGLSNPSSSYDLVMRLRDKGLVAVGFGANRAVTVTPEGRGWLLVDRARRHARVVGV